MRAGVRRETTLGCGEMIALPAGSTRLQEPDILLALLPEHPLRLLDVVDRREVDVGAENRHPAADGTAKGKDVGRVPRRLRRGVGGGESRLCLKPSKRLSSSAARSADAVFSKSGVNNCLVTMWPGFVWRRNEAQRAVPERHERKTVGTLLRLPLAFSLVTKQRLCG